MQLQTSKLLRTSVYISSFLIAGQLICSWETTSFRNSPYGNALLAVSSPLLDLISTRRGRWGSIAAPAHAIPRASSTAQTFRAFRQSGRLIVRWIVPRLEYVKHIPFLPRSWLFAQVVNQICRICYHSFHPWSN